MGEPLSPDRVFDFPADELELHPAYDFFALRLLPGYAGNLNNNHGWIEADVSLLGELRVVADELMVGPIVDEIAEPVDEAEEQVIALVVGMDEDIAMLFGDDDFEDDDSSDDNSEGVEEEEVWEVNEEWLMAPITPPLVPAVQPSSVYKVRGPSTVAAEGPSFPLPASRDLCCLNSPQLDNGDPEQINQMIWKRWTLNGRSARNSGNMSRDAGNAGYRGRDNDKRSAKEEDEKALVIQFKL
nr:hypothetical protein [Tanacetum cinerariifolium]